MAGITIRLKDFTLKSSPTINDMVYLGDAADSFNEVKATIGDIINSYPALTSIGALTTTVGNLIYTTASDEYAALAPVTRAVLTMNSSSVPVWIQLNDGQIVIGSTAGNPAAATLTAGANIGISVGSNSVTISSTGGSGYVWTEVSGTSQLMAVDNAYVANNAGVVTLTLPASSAVGDTVIVQGKGAGGWLIAQNSGQTIHFGSVDTTPGVGGSLASTARYDSIEMVCITANTDWAVMGVQGIITVV